MSAANAGSSARTLTRGVAAPDACNSMQLQTDDPDQTSTMADPANQFLNEPYLGEAIETFVQRYSSWRRTVVADKSDYTKLKEARGALYELHAALLEASGDKTAAAEVRSRVAANAR